MINRLSLIIIMKITQIHIAISILCFITVILSLFFGMGIFNANENLHVTHLNEYDEFSYYNTDDIPVLTAKAVIITGCFLLITFALQIYSYFKTTLKQHKTIIIFLLGIYLILFFFSFFVMADLENRNFYHFGMIWVLLSIILIFANGILIFLKKIPK